MFVGVHDVRRAERQPEARRRSASTSRSRRRSPAGTWRARRCASAPPAAACSPARRPARRPARSTACTTRSRRSAGWRRWLHMMFGEISPGGVGVGLMGMLHLRPARRVHRRADGRANTGVPRQEDPGARDEAGDAVHPGDAVRAAGVRRGVGGAARRADTYQAGPHGLSEVLYNFASASNNNGSAFAYQGTGTQWYTMTQGISMLIGPLLPDHPGARRSAARWPPNRRCRRPAGTLPTHTPLFGVLVVGVIVIVAGLTFFPALALGPILEHLSLLRTDDRNHDCNIRNDSGPSRAHRRCARKAPGVEVDLRSGDRQDGDRSTPFKKLNPRTMMRNPVMFIVEVGSVLTTLPVHPRLRRAARRQAERVRRARGGVAVVHRAVRQLRRGDGRRAAARPRPRRCARPGPTRSPRVRHARRHDRRRSRRRALQVGDLCVVVGRRGDPRRRRHRRGHRHGRRVGDHRRVGPGDPRVGRRPLGGHRRHAGAERRDRRAHHGQAGRDVPRPDDRPRRGRQPAEDTERDRPVDPARRA